MMIEFSEADKRELALREPRFAELYVHYRNIMRVEEPDLFYSLIRSIAGQQVSGAAQESLMNKLKAKLKTITPHTLSRLRRDELKALGASGPKAEYMHGAAAYFLNLSDSDLTELKELDNDAFINEITQIKGVGVWTAEMLLLFSLKRRDILSIHDLGIRRGLKALYGYEEISPERAWCVQKLYGEQSSLASLYLWEHSKDYEKQEEPEYKMAYESPFGWLYAKAGQRGLCFLKHESQLSELEQKAFKQEENRDAVLGYLACELDSYFAKEFTHFSVPLDYKMHQLSDFSIRVYNALKELSFGQATSYKGLASLAKSPKAARAIGNIMGKNPWPIVVPCHKVLKSDGSLGGFSLPLSLKKSLLEFEGITYS